MQQIGCDLWLYDVRYWIRRVAINVIVCVFVFILVLLFYLPPRIVTDADSRLLSVLFQFVLVGSGQTIWHQLRCCG
jgi:hypothetical protein